MKKKSQIRKYTVQKVSQMYQAQHIPQMLIIYAEHVSEKTQPLTHKKQTLFQQIQKNRAEIQKIIRQMNDGLKSRIEKENLVILDAKSRPTTADVKELTQLYSYMEQQYRRIWQNNEDIKKIQNRNLEELQKMNIPKYQYSELDQQFQKLNKLCQEELIVKGQLQIQVIRNRQFYKLINQNIEKSRKQYDVVEEKIREREKQLDHLKTYFKIRQDEDAQKVTDFDMIDKRVGVNEQFFIELVAESTRNSELQQAKSWESLNPKKQS